MMKKIIFLAIFSTAAISVSFTFYDPYYKSEYTPVFMSREELRKSVFFVNEARDLKSPGKIYYKAPYLYVCEKYKGVHVINNSDPQNPAPVAFIVAPGCMDVAIKGDILYLDNAVDLVAFNLTTRQVTKRIENVLPEPITPSQESFVSKRPENMILVGWRKTKK